MLKRQANIEKDAQNIKKIAQSSHTCPTVFLCRLWKPLTFGLIKVKAAHGDLLRQNCFKTT